MAILRRKCKVPRAPSAVASGKSDAHTAASTHSMPQTRTYHKQSHSSSSPHIHSSISQDKHSHAENIISHSDFARASPDHDFPSVSPASPSQSEIISGTHVSATVRTQVEIISHPIPGNSQESSDQNVISSISSLHFGHDVSQSLPDPGDPPVNASNAPGIVSPAPAEHVAPSPSGSNASAKHVSLLYMNARSLVRNNVDVAFAIEKSDPDILCFTETWLKNSIEQFHIAGYKCIARFDRQDGRAGGGVCVYAKSHVHYLVHVKDSVHAERSWVYLHSDQGIFAIAIFYRPPDANDDAILSLRHELAEHVSQVCGIIVLGDFNIHHRRWLRHSNANTPQGEVLQAMCQEYSLQQLVSEPTRGEYLLDLVLSDLPCNVKVMPMVADINACF